MRPCLRTPRGARPERGCRGEEGQEQRGGGGAGLERGLPGSLSLPARGWALCGTSWVIRCPSSPANLSEASHALKASPRAWQAKGSSVPTPPPIQIGHLVTQEVSTEHRAPSAPRALAEGGTGWTPSSWDGAFPERPPPLRPRCLLSGAWGLL